MHTITLKKSSPSHTFSHIYEHAYVIALDTALRGDGLVPIVDYDIFATTNLGEVSIEIESYGNDLREYVQRIDSDALMLSEYIETAVAQVEVEKGQRFEVGDGYSLREALEAFHYISWGESANLGSELRGVGSLKPVMLTITTPYPNLDSKLLPLYRLAAGVALNGAANDVADSYAGFIESAAFSVNQSGELEVSVLLHPDVDVTGVRYIAEQSFHEVLFSKSMERLFHALQDVEAMEYPPSSTFHYGEVEVEMSPDAWRRMATVRNLEQIRQNGRIVVDINKQV